MQHSTPSRPDINSITYNDLEQLNRVLTEHGPEIACLVIEPVIENLSIVLPDEGYLAAVRQACDDHGVVLIFDEVMTGFRAAPGGAQERYGVVPDMTTLGKIIGGGLPVGAYGGRADLMELVSPAGPVYQAGTLSGNPLAMTAGIWCLDGLKPGLYRRLSALGARLAMGVAWTAIIAAELAVGAKSGGGTSGGIGQMMFVFYAYSIDLNGIVVCMIVVGVVALLLDRAFRAAERRLLPWRR